MNLHRVPAAGAELLAILAASVAAVPYAAYPLCKAPGTDSLRPFSTAATRTQTRNVAQSRAQVH
jgi:hypothetical protein